MNFSRFTALLSFSLRDAAKSRIVLGLTIVSLGMAFTAVFLSGGILEGFKKTLADGVITTSGHLIVHPKKGSLSIENRDAVVQKLRSIPEVAGVSSRSYSALLLRNGDKVMGPYQSIGLVVADEQKTTDIPEKIIEGSFIDDTSLENEVVLGVTIADALIDLPYDNIRVKAGDTIEIQLFNGTYEHYRVRGIIDAKTFHPNWTTYFSKKRLEQTAVTRKDSEIVVKLKDASSVEAVRKKLLDADLDVQVTTWEEEAGYMNNMLAAVSFVTGSIEKLLIASVFVITSVIIFINVFQKRRQIGILKSMGASNAFVVSIYLIETLLYSFFSYLLGFLLFLGVHLQSNKNPIPLLIGDFHTVLNADTLLLSFGTLLVAALGGSLLPAVFAARTEIATSVRDTV